MGRERGRGREREGEESAVDLVQRDTLERDTQDEQSFALLCSRCHGV